MFADRLFRIEKDKRGIFNDNATQSVWYRNMPPQQYEVKETHNCLEVITNRVTLHVAAKMEHSYVLLNGEKYRSIMREI